MTDSAYSVPPDVAPNSSCVVCGLSVRKDLDSASCRVCNKSFHEKCVRENYEVSRRDLEHMKNASTDVGWSCPECDNIYNLLNAMEMSEVNQLFREIDANDDDDISFDEFMDFERKLYRKLFNKEMLPVERDAIKRRYEAYDADNNGSIGYKEFCMYHAGRLLGKRPKAELVEMLTPLEKVAAKKMFEMLDKNRDGTLNMGEISEAYRNFYTYLDSLKKAPPKAGFLNMVKEEKERGITLAAANAKQRERAVILKAQVVMSSDENDDEAIDWREFIRGQAFYIICSRTNKYGIRTNDTSLSHVALAQSKVKEAAGTSGSAGSSKAGKTGKKKKA